MPLLVPPRLLPTPLHLLTPRHLLFMQEAPIFFLWQLAAIYSPSVGSAKMYTSAFSRFQFSSVSVWVLA